MVAESTITKYMAKRGNPSGQRWGAFLHHHAPHIAAMDLFSGSDHRLYSGLRCVCPAGSARACLDQCDSAPDGRWIAQQLTEAFPWMDPRYLIRNRDGIYGAAVPRRLRAMAIRNKPVAPGSPWQNGFVERLIGPIRREYVDHMIVLGEARLRRILGKYVTYYNQFANSSLTKRNSLFPHAIEHLGVITSRPSLAACITDIAESDFRYAQAF